MLTHYTVHACVRAEGAIGNFSLRAFNLQMEDEPHAVFGSMLVTQAISAIRRLGYETLYIETIVES